MPAPINQSHAFMTWLKAPAEQLMMCHKVPDMREYALAIPPCSSSLFVQFDGTRLALLAMQLQTDFAHSLHVQLP